MEYVIDIDAVLPVMKTWFSRAKTCPLSLTMRSPYVRLPVAVLSMIPEVAGHLHRLELSVCTEDLEDLKEFHISLPRLERLALDAANSPDLRPLFSIFPNTPSLRDLDVPRANAYHGFGISIPILDLYPNLTRLALSHVSLGLVLQILECRPQLMHLAVHLPEPASPTPFPQTAVHLQSLVLSGDSSSAQAALNSLTLPHLLRLELDIGPRLTPLYLLSFLQRSACPLDHATLGLNCSPVFKELFMALRSLTSLKVQGNHYAMMHFYELLDERALLPCLQTLSMQVASENFHYAALAKTLRARRSRADASHRIEFVHIDLYRESRSDDEDDHWFPRWAVDEFTRLIAEGLQIRVVFESEEGWPERRVDYCESFLELRR
ncbi:hypothetical protein C8R44DRAFT_876991 [Mycena epipterygia]|nr:hypothetical protein C8R44DRAFT_876991 [Mycena epipterygia]